MPKRIEVRAITRATFEGGQWEEVRNDGGKLIGFRDAGTNCSVFLGAPDGYGEYFEVSNNQLVHMENGFAVVLQGEDAEEKCKLAFGNEEE